MTLINEYLCVIGKEEENVFETIFETNIINITSTWFTH